MGSYTEKIEKLVSLKADLATNLNSKGVSADTSEKFNTLVPKVLDVPQTGIDTSDATATAADMLSGVTAYVKGEKVTGAIPTKTGRTYTPKTTDQVIEAGQYLSGKQTVKGDANLIAANIKAGVKLFAVTGTHAGADDLTEATATAEDIKDGLTAYGNGGELITGTAHTVSRVTVLTPGTDSVYLDPGFYSGVSVVGSPALLAGNIRQGVEIFGIVGAYSGGGGGVIEDTLLDTNAAISAQDTLDVYGDGVYIYESSTSSVLTLAAVVEKWGGITAQNNFIGTAAQKYGVKIANWTESDCDTGILLSTPLETSGGKMLVTLNAYVNSWMSPMLGVHLIAADSVEQAAAKVLDGDYAVTKSVQYAGSMSLQDNIVNVGAVGAGTYFLYIDGTKKADNSDFTYNRIEVLVY